MFVVQPREAEAFRFSFKYKPIFVYRIATHGRQEGFRLAFYVCLSLFLCCDTGEARAPDKSMISFPVT